jgi:Rieske Fe-S protein
MEEIDNSMSGRRSALKKLANSMPFLLTGAIGFISLFRKNPDSQKAKLVLGTKYDVFKVRNWRLCTVGNKQIIVLKDKNDNITAFHTACTHAGCPVEWRAEQQQFYCACHGALFNADGTVVSGPARKPLEKIKVIQRQNTGEIVLIDMPGI